MFFESILGNKGEFRKVLIEADSITSALERALTICKDDEVVFSVFVSEVSETVKG